MLSDQATLLNEVLSRYIILRHHLQQSHWVVQGPFFLSWHEMFEKHYDLLGEMIDSFAEKLRAHDVLKAKKLALISLEGQEPEVSSDHQSGLLKNLLVIIEPLIKTLQEIVIDPKMAEYPTIVDELTEHLGALDKIVWFYQASLVPLA